MTTQIPETAFILAAGFGKRLRPYTDTVPKPMVPVCGKPVIDYIIDKLVQSGVKRVIVNLHHMGNVLHTHLTQRTDVEITFSEEEEILNTGGGVKHALHRVGTEPFFVINGDAFWIDGPDTNAFERLANMWKDKDMDMILLLEPVERMTLTKPVGDYNIEKDGKATRLKAQDGAYMFAGVRLCHPRIFKDAPDDAFSFLLLMDGAEEKGRLYGLEHKGSWHHISSPEELHAVEEAFC